MSGNGGVGMGRAAGVTYGIRLYSRTSMARPPLGPWQLVRDRGSSS